MQGEGVKNYCCLSSKLSMHPSHCLASVLIREKRLCGLDRPETRRWVDREWPLWAFHLQELRRRTLFNKAANQSHVQQQAAKQLLRVTAGAEHAALVEEQAPAWIHSISEEGLAHTSTYILYRIARFYLLLFWSSVTLFISAATSPNSDHGTGFEPSWVHRGWNIQPMSDTCRLRLYKSMCCRMPWPLICGTHTVLNHRNVRGCCRLEVDALIHSEYLALNIY